MLLTWVGMLLAWFQLLLNCNYEWIKSTNKKRKSGWGKYCKTLQKNIKNVGSPEVSYLFFVFLFVLPELWFPPFRSELGEPARVLSPNPKSLMQTGWQRCPGLRKSLASLAEQHLHDLGVGQGWEVTQVFFVACDLSQNSPHDLTCRTGERLEFQEQKQTQGGIENDPSTWTCFGKPWSILDEIWGGYWSDLLPH